MKKTEQSFNSTLKMGNCELKRQRIAPVSSKRKAQNAEYSKICAQLKDLTGDISEYSGLEATCWPLECHHICGRTNGKLLDPFNILVCKRSEHEEIHEHNTHEQKLRLQEIVRTIRLRQGFKYIQDGKSIYTGGGSH